MTTRPSSINADRTRGVVRGYVRVSTEMQARDGVSLETQVNAINAFATYKGYLVEEIVTDAGISGRSLADRPNLIAILSRLKKKEHLVVHSMSRLARNLKETMEIYNLIKQRGSYFVSLDLEINTNTAMGRMIFQILASLAEFESNQISERVAESMGTLISQSKLITKPKYGWYSPGKGLKHLPHEGQQKSIEILVNLYLGNNRLWTTSRIAKELDEHKVPTHTKAKRWYASRVRQILIDNLMDYNPQPDSSSDDSSSETESDDDAQIVVVPSTPLRIPNPQYDYSSPETPVALIFHAQSP
jgi:site-specific DNA recombinase